MLLIVSDKFLGKLRLELLKLNFDKARVLTMFILPIKVSFYFSRYLKSYSYFTAFH